MNANILMTNIADAVSLDAADRGIRDMRVICQLDSIAFALAPFTVYVRNNDNQIRVTVENRGIIAEATFSNMPADVIAPIVSAYLFAK